MKILLLFGVASIFSLSLFSQTSISGTVRDNQGNLLPGANIYIANSYDGTSSNGSGYFEFTTSETGAQKLIVDFIGFEMAGYNVNLTGAAIIQNIELKESFNELEAVNITANAFEASDKKKSIAITSLDMVTTPSATGDIYGALQTLPGTSTVGESGKLYVKGGESRESKTFIDGTLVYVPYSSSAPSMPVRGRFNPFMFSGTMFNTGGYSAEYGQALSGVLSLKTNEIPVEDQLNISLLTVGLGLSGTKTFEKSALTATLNYNNLKPYMKLVPQNTQWNDEPSSLNGELSYRLKTKKSGLLKFYVNKSQSNLSLFNPNLSAADNQNNYALLNQNTYANASWIGELDKKWILSTGISYTHNIDYVTLDTAKYNEYLKGGHAKAMLSKKITEKVKLKLGVELYSKEFKNAYESNFSSFYKMFTNNTLAAFVESDLYASNKFVTRIGSRIEYSDYLNRWNAAPRLLSAYKFNKNSQVSFAYGWFFQDPDNADLLYSHTLNYERADHYTLNFQYEKNNRVLRSELYYKDYKNLVKYTDAPFYESKGYNNQGRGYATGFDLFWRDNKTLKFGEYWISYSYIDTKRNSLDYPELAIPTFSSKHNLTLVYKYWIGSLRSMFGASYKIASPRVYNNPNSVIFNGEKTIPYQTLDINWSFLYRQNVVVYASVSNVPGFKQQFGYNYSANQNDNGVYEKTPVNPAARRFFLVACFITLSKKGDVNQMDKIN